MVSGKISNRARQDCNNRQIRILLYFSNVFFFCDFPAVWNSRIKIPFSYFAVEKKYN